MMLALYVVLGWSLAGFVAALVIGRAIALSNGEPELLYSCGADDFLQFHDN